MTKIFSCAVVLRRCAVVPQVIENTYAAAVRWLRAVVLAAVRGGLHKSLKNLVRWFCGGWGVCIPNTPYTLRFPLRGNARVTRYWFPREIGGGEVRPMVIATVLPKRIGWPP